eukprot:scaffold16707_cov182-Amphora_coffeaeformis.AAC.6
MKSSSNTSANTEYYLSAIATSEFLGASQALRRQRRLGKPWKLCHIDSHPDLACPSNGIPAGACFRPTDEWTIIVPSEENNGEKGETRSGCLYELLDLSTTGISEWILPMVLAAGLTHVEWVKPAAPKNRQSTSQIPLGTHKFHVGAFDESQDKVSSFLDITSEASVMVDWDCLYYRDDDAFDFYAPLHSLHLPQPLELRVIEWQQRNESPASCPNYGNEDGPWILDICLDYFYCVNPFLADIELVDNDLARITYDLVALSTFYDTAQAFDPVDRDGLLRFRRTLRDVLHRLAIPKDPSHVSVTKLSEELSPFTNGKTDEAAGLLEKMSIRLQTLREEERAKSLVLIEESLSYAMLPHSRLGDSATIEEHVAVALCEFESGLRNRFQHAKHLPFLVTIARSMHDGFTPESLADYLEKKVIGVLHRCLCGQQCDSASKEELCCFKLLLYHYKDGTGGIGTGIGMEWGTGEAGEAVGTVGTTEGR